MASDAGKTSEHADPGHGSNQPHEHHGTREYYVIYVALMVLLILTVVASYIPFDRLMPGLNALVALLIAAIKAALVMFFFMHLNRAHKLTWTFAAAAFLWLGIMFTLTLSDYLSRRALPSAIASSEPQAARPFPMEHINGPTSEEPAGEPMR
jgi:cytochrome c oxidase subunit 4